MALAAPSGVPPLGVALVEGALWMLDWMPYSVESGPSALLGALLLKLHGCWNPLSVLGKWIPKVLTLCGRLGP